MWLNDDADRPDSFRRAFLFKLFPITSVLSQHFHHSLLINFLQSSFEPKLANFATLLWMNYLIKKSWLSVNLTAFWKQNSLEYLRWSFFVKIFHGQMSLIIFCSIVDVRLGSNYATRIVTKLLVSIYFSTIKTASFSCQSFKHQPHKMVKHTQTICWQFELFTCVWPFWEIDA